MKHIQTGDKEAGHSKKGEVNKKNSMTEMQDEIKEWVNIRERQETMRDRQIQTDRNRQEIMGDKQIETDKRQ